MRRRGRLGAAYRLALAVLRPVALVMTRPSWTGTEHVPERGGVIVAVNHTSLADPVVVADFLLHGTRLVPRFLAKRELFRGWGPIALVLRRAGQIPVDRDVPGASQALDPALAALRAGCCVVVYPEGALTRDPDLWPMVGRTGVARLALLSGAPVLPVAQWGAQQFHALPAAAARRGPGRRWPRRPVAVRVGPPVDLSPWHDHRPGEAVLRQATAAVMDAITRELEVLRGQPAPEWTFDPRREPLSLVGTGRRTA